MAPSEKQEVKKTSKISTKEKEMLQEESISEELPDSSELEAVAMQNIRNRKRRDVLAEKKVNILISSFQKDMKKN